MACLMHVEPVLMVRDVEAAIAFYQRLGFAVAFRDDPAVARYAGVRREGIELHLQWHDAKEWSYPVDRPSYRFGVDDVEGLYAEFRDRGHVKDVSAVRDTPWHTREFHARDPDGNVLQFYKAKRM